MSEVAMTDIAMERSFLDMPYEILFKIFRRLSKSKLIAISKLCSKFRDVAGDARFWKDVYIKYEPNEKITNDIFAFEELYSEPWPVDAIDLLNTKIKHPVPSKTDQVVVKVKRLNLSSISADKVTTKAILAKYQCTELYLDLCNEDHIMGIWPEIFSKQTVLKVLSLSGTAVRKTIEGFAIYYKLIYLSNFQLLGLIKNLPPSLEKLYLVGAPNIEDSFFELLAQVTPNLKEIKLCSTKIAAKFPSLLNFKFLENLHIYKCNYQDIDDLIEYLVQFPALKNVHIDHISFGRYSEAQLGNLPEKFESHGITLRPPKKLEWSYFTYGTLWKVSKTV